MSSPHTFYLTDNSLDSLPQFLINHKNSSSQIDIYINSSGGNILSAISAISLMNSHKGIITTYIIGCAESSAILIAMSGHVRIAHVNSWGMIHPVTISLEGSYHELKSSIKHNRLVLEAVRNTILANSSANEDKIDSLLGPLPTWLSATELLQLGLIDHLVSPPEPSQIP